MYLSNNRQNVYIEKKQISCHIFMRQLIPIGAARFELATSRPPAVRATKLRHTP